MNIEAFLEIEKKYSLYTKQCKGVYYWNYARMSVWNYKLCLVGNNLQETHEEKKYTFVQKMKKAAGLLNKFIFRGHVPRQVDILFLPHERRTKAEVYKCIYTDDIAASYPDSFMLDRPYEHGHFSPESDVARMYIDYILIWGNSLRNIHKGLKMPLYTFFYNEIKKELIQPLTEMVRTYDLDIKVQEIIGFVVDMALGSYFEYGMYEKLLDKLHPRLIVETVYYSTHNMMINEIAKKKNIPTVELQHGTMHSEHAAYQFASGIGPIPQLPDKIFLFSDFWRRYIHLPIEEKNLISTGFPYFEEQKKKYNGKREHGTVKNILFVSQGTIGLELSKLAVEISGLLPREQYHIIYKLHPAEYGVWRQKYKWLENCDIEVIDSSARNIYEFFSLCDIQVGVYSTALYEGLGFGLLTLIYHIGHANTMQELVDEGYAEFFADSEQLAGLIVNGSRQKDNTSFWKENAFENIRCEINKLLQYE